MSVVSTSSWEAILERLDDAAVVSGIDPEIHEFLRLPKRVLEVSVPVRMDDVRHGEDRSASNKCETDALCCRACECDGNDRPRPVFKQQQFDGEGWFGVHPLVVDILKDMKKLKEDERGGSR